MFMGGPTHVGVADAGPGAAAKVLWSVALGSSVDSSPAVVGGRVSVGTADGDLCAVNADQGTVAWRFSTGGAVVSSPAVAGDRVIFGSVDGFIYCLGTADGKLLWKYRTWKPVTAPATVAEGVAYVGSVDGTLTALALDQGEVRWQAQDPAAITGAPVVANGWVFYGDRAGTVRARRADTGKQVWAAAERSPVVGSPSLSGKLLLVPYMCFSAITPPQVDSLVAYDGANGSPVWALNTMNNHPASVSVFTTPAIADGVAYFATVEGYLSATEMHAVSLADGSLLWKQGIDTTVTVGAATVPAHNVVMSSPVVAGDYLYFGAGDGSLWVLQRQTGQVAARVALAQKIYSSPAVTGGRVYIGAGDGKLYCVGQ
jgi:outer membrane protein assembly factor BamB